METELLSVKNLTTHFDMEGKTVHAVSALSFTLSEKEILGIVGESGSGKSVTSLSILRLLPQNSGKVHAGEVLFRGENLLDLNESAMAKIRGNKISMIFQDPMTSLNPYLKISRQMTDLIMLHKRISRRAAYEKAVEMLELVGIDDASRRITAYASEFSGGMRQRVMIAMALSCEPDILFADEPTTALDVSIQAQILDLLKDLTNKMGTALVMISHDLGVIAGLCDTIAVMYAGQMLEYGPKKAVFENPCHPYTKALIQAVPRLDKKASRLKIIRGQGPDHFQKPANCPFAPRCNQAMDSCATSLPAQHAIDSTHWVKCFLFARTV